MCRNFREQDIPVTFARYASTKLKPSFPSELPEIQQGAGNILQILIHTDTI